MVGFLAELEVLWNGGGGLKDRRSKEEKKKKKSLAQRISTREAYRVAFGAMDGLDGTAGGGVCDPYYHSHVASERAFQTTTTQHKGDIDGHLIGIEGKECI